jgi:uncharacterized protein
MTGPEAIIGREEERELLLRALRTPRSELIAVFGRRRVGKTFLIRNLFKEQLCLELTGIHRGTMQEQLAAFHGALRKQGRRWPMPADWMEAFEQLSRHISTLPGKKKPTSAKPSAYKKVVFIDELPWLDSPRSRFLPAFSHFWNSFASSRNDLVVVICGSAASYMINEVINDRGGLHNRVTQRIRLAPFTLGETEHLLRRKGVKLTRYDIVQLYMALGGVPHYLDLVERGESVAQAIDRLFFERNGYLRGEFDNVFASLFEHAANHEAVVRALSTVRAGLTRNAIAKRSKLPSGGRLTVTLNELERSGFIERYLPYKGIKDPLFRLSDEYSLFYLRFVQNGKPARRGHWAKVMGTPTYKAWSGFTFETICMKHVERIKDALRIGGVRSTEGSWIGKGDESGAQIDLLIDRDDNVINLCEMKFASGPFTIDKKYAQELAAKVDVFTKATLTRKSVLIAFITTHGVARNVYSTQLVQNEVLMDDLFVGS